MEQTPASISPASPPLACAFSLAELPGRLSKTLEVPANHQGIVLDAAGKARLLPPGRHKVLSNFDRLRAKGAGLQAGYLPAGEFSASLRANNLLSGDGQLIDASLICQVTVADAGRFFVEQVLPQKELRQAAVDLGSPALFEAISALVQRYLAADLAQGLPAQRLTGEFLNVLGPVLEQMGLRLESIQFLAFWLSENRLEVARKTAELQERLRDIEVQAQMAALESQAQLDDFTRQLQGELGLEAGLRPVAMPQEPAAGQPAAAPLPQWAAAQTAPAAPPPPWRLQNLFGSKKAAQDEKEAEAQRSARRFRSWVIGRFITNLVLFTLACLLSAGLLWGIEAASWDIKGEFLLLFWSPGIALLLQTLVAFFQKKEELAEMLWKSKGMTYLNELAHNKRPRIDQLVREQSAEDLRQTLQILRDVRSRVYAQGRGDENLALRIRNTIENKIETYAQDLQNPTFGKAPYLSDLRISQQVWDNMLDYDERLLVQSALVSSQAQTLQQALSAGQPIGEGVDAFENLLDQFHHAFANRAHALKADDKKS